MVVGQGAVCVMLSAAASWLWWGSDGDEPSDFSFASGGLAGSGSGAACGRVAKVGGLGAVEEAAV